MWKQEVDRVYPEPLVKDALNVMGLFIMNRFRDITREEVTSVLNFDLMDTVAGTQIFEEGVEKGIKKGVEEGMNQGELIGEIRMAQRILKCTVSSKDELAQKNTEELKQMFQQIEAELRAHHRC
ncbi:MAG: hypothetical protein GY749_42175 [Desulfobacteraceae bacterium]|nr:hypothetical protein [Desulfobacteraceae bacterium]